MRARRDIRAARRRGYTLLAIVVFLTVSLAFVSINQRRLSAILRVERSVLAADDFSEGPVLAMAKALAALESGLPPSSPYDCCVTLNTAAGSRSFAVRFTQSTGTRWSIQVSPATDPAALPPLPTTFDR